jgi:hypothetical protein
MKIFLVSQCGHPKSICKNRTESIHQQTPRKKQPMADRKYKMENFYVVEKCVKIKKKYDFKILEICKICYT